MAAHSRDELEEVIPRWFSANSNKAWAERCFLLYTPVWMLVMGLVMVFGIDRRLGDPGFILLGILIALPYALIPAFLSPEKASAPWHRAYWFKANLYMLVFGFFGNYFGSEYFFDVLGMVYHYPAIDWTLDAALVGSGEQVVPIGMYLFTHAYFMTYHSTATVVLRRIRTSDLPGMRLIFPAAIFVIGYVWAWLETKAMANPFIAESFHYEKMDRMLAYGSVFYALYFVASFPIYYSIDEEEPWSLRRTLFAALAASMIVFFLLDFATHAVELQAR
jgi:cycloeucalenol cycloisomerase